MHDNPLDTGSWMIDLHSWIILDGNYPDFYTGQRTDFAVEFASRDGLTRLDGAPEPRVRWIADSRYKVTAQVVYDEPNAQVIDFGALAYHFIGIEDPEHRSQVGSWVTGEINLGVDPFFYFDELADVEGFPALIYSWTVQKVLQREETSRLVTVERTDAWGDVSTSPSYVLHCRMEPAPRSSVRSPGHTMS